MSKSMAVERKMAALGPEAKKFGRISVSNMFIFATILCLFGASGCVQQGGAKRQPPPSSTRPPEPPPVEHEVQYSGETLALIANWYTGRSQNWTLIREANPGLRPERMNIGQRIIIPGYLVIQREPLPRRLIGSRPKTTAPTEVPTEDTGTQVGGVTDVPPTSDVVPTPNTGENGGAQPSFDDLLNDAMVGGDAAKQPTAEIPPPPPVAPPAEVGAPAVNNAPAPAANAPSGGGDAEREKLLDELLTQ